MVDGNELEAALAGADEIHRHGGRVLAMMQAEDMKGGKAFA